MVNYTTKQINDAITRVETFIKTNNRNPATIKVGNDTLELSKFLQLSEIVDAKNRVLNFYKTNSKYPNYVTIAGYNFRQYRILFSISVIDTNTNADDVYNYFCTVFGSVKTIDDALLKIKNRGYNYYYNDVYSNKTCIDRMKNNKTYNYKTINCTDSCQVFYHIGKALGYEVKCLHVQCQSGGHVRLQFKHKTNTGGNWINRDPACVLSVNCKDIKSIWCENGKIIDTNPSWWLNTVNK